MELKEPIYTQPDDDETEKKPSHVEIDDKEEFAFLSTYSDGMINFHWINLMTGQELKQTTLKEILQLDDKFKCYDNQKLLTIKMENNVEYLFSVVYLETEDSSESCSYMIVWTCHDFKVICSK